MNRTFFSILLVCLSLLSACKADQTPAAAASQETPAPQRDLIQSDTTAPVKTDPSAMPKPTPLPAAKAPAPTVAPNPGVTTVPALTQPALDTAQLRLEREAAQRREQEAAAAAAAERKRREQEAERKRRDALAQGVFSSPGRAGNGSPGVGDVASASLAFGGGLAGRRLMSKPSMSDNSTQTGIVNVLICVDAQGNVTSADYTLKGSTTTSEELRAKALEWARQFKFAASDAQQQCGTVTFNFRLR